MNHDLSFTTKKALSVHLGESAGQEVASLLKSLILRIEQLEANKVDVIPIVPTQLNSEGRFPLRRAA